MKGSFDAGASFARRWKKKIYTPLTDLTHIEGSGEYKRYGKIQTMNLTSHSIKMIFSNKWTAAKLYKTPLIR